MHDQTRPTNEAVKEREHTTRPGTSQSVRRVAVLGVHGVAHHDPGATANAMADLLLSLPSYEPQAPQAVQPRYYDSFRAVGVQIPLQRVRVAAPPHGCEKSGVLEERSLTFAKQENAYVKSGGDGPGNAYTQLLLECYGGAADGDAYVTTRLEGKRSDGKSADAEVHIYEVLWADLARPTNTFLSFFLALFQLIIHLGSLSRIALDTGANEHPGWLWRCYGWAQRWAVRMLQLPLPLLKLILLVLLISCVPAVSKDLRGAAWLAPFLGGVGGAAVAAIHLTKKQTAASSPWLWSGYAIIPPALGAIIGYLLARYTTPASASALECWLIVGGALLTFILNKYEEVRHGARSWGWTAYLIGLAVFATLLFCKADSVPQASFWTAEWLIAAVRFSWWCLFLFAFLALGLGSRAWRSVTADPSKRARARAAVRTSRFALALPALLFVQITSLIWVSMFSLADRVEKPFFATSLLTAPPGGEWLVKAMLIPNPSEIAFKGDYLKGIVAWSVGYQAPVSLALFLVALFLLGWWILPGTLTEKFPLRNDGKPPHNHGVPPRYSSDAETLSLGTWLSRGLDATSVVTFLFWTAMFAAPVGYYLLGCLSWIAPSMCTVQNFLKQGTIHIVASLAVAVAGAILAILVKYGSSALGAVLDVDRYLQTNPIKATPRAKIFERYVSTLRFLARYKGADGRGYDSIVIVSHSLGTLISADLLRYLYAKGDPELAAIGLGQPHAYQPAQSQPEGSIALRLLTMGSPIRQLLNRFFPYLYDWVRSAPDNGLRPLPPPCAVPAIASNASPDPAELGVMLWVNAYRSGDYVGRSLWMDEWYRHGGIQNGSRKEICIGAGAHTHYWDDTAPEVANTLNDLISM